ncbi:MAG: hypothetical protein J6V50_04780, partial [Clostridia bacterium]|nr:hypothetical protein [Clostridia bacterium]
PEGIVYLDQDFEVYNSTNGSKENVISGKYSIHRKGEEFRFSAFSPLVSGDGGTGTLVLGAGYRITMWVKIDKHSHEDGAIEIATCNAEKYSWSVVGNWKKIAAVKDLADGEWHQISFDFITSGKFLSIKVPGNLSVYFDDVELEYLPGLQASDCSKEVEVTEYVPMRYSESKTFLNSELDEGLFKLTGGSIIANLTAGNVILVCVAVIVVGALAVTVCVVLRKKRKGAEK